jgi:hypothetical protein
MKLRLGPFTGEQPRLHPRYLPDGSAQISRNSKMERGALTPIRMGRFVETLPAPAGTIYLYRGVWFSWPGVVDVVPAPIAEDRLYVTGDGVPKLISGGVTYPLAVPLPVAAPSAVLQSGTPDPALQKSIAYAYTWVTSFAEESEPSPLSNEILWSATLKAVVSGFDTPPTGRAVTTMRIYRSETSALGETNLYFIAERDASAADFIDDVDVNVIQNVIPSASYNAPPDTLQGIISMANGMMAAFDGKKIYFCEPYQPHAWPEKYVLTTDYTIVGLGSIGTTLMIMTAGQPYMAAGSAPENMVMEKLQVTLPCLSKQSIANLGDAVAYASPNGLVTITTSGASLQTAQLITREEWLLYEPQTFIAAAYDGRYLAGYSIRDPVTQQVIDQGMLIIDLSGDQPFLLRAADRPMAAFHDIGSGGVFLLVNSTDIWQWDDTTQPYGAQLWKGKQHVYTTPMNFGAILIEGEDTLTADQWTNIRTKNDVLRAAIQAGSAVLPGDGGTSLLTPDPDGPDFAVIVYGDGQAIDVIDDINAMSRLPAGDLYSMYEVEVRGNLQVSQVSLGSQPSELGES